MWQINTVVTNDINYLHVWNYKIGLNNFTNYKLCKQNFYHKNTKGKNLKNCTCVGYIVVMNDINELHVWNYKINIIDWAN